MSAIQVFVILTSRKIEGWTRISDILFFSVNFMVRTNTSSEDIRSAAEHTKTFPVKLVKRAEVSIRATVEPKNIWYGGIFDPTAAPGDEGSGATSAEGESRRHSSMPRVMSDIGNKITHSFQVFTGISLEN